MHRNLLILFASFVVLSGCSTVNKEGVQQLSHEPALPTELSKDMQEKFEIKETVEAPKSLVPLTTEHGKDQKNLKKAPKKMAQVEQKSFVFPSRRPEKDPLHVGEKVVYEITYFGMAAGDFTIEVMPYKTINERKVYHVSGQATSSKVFSLFYRLNDKIETFFDYEGLFAHRFHIVLDEAKQTRDSLELYDSEKKQTYYWNRWNHKTKGYTEIKEFFPIDPFPQDSLSALYYLRMVKMPAEGQSISFPVVSEGKTWEAQVTLVRRQQMNTPFGKKTVLVLKPETKYQGILKKQGDSFLYLIDDEHRYMVRLEAKVKIGTVVAQLKSAEPGQP